MIKFEKDGFAIIFLNALDAAEWLETQWENNGRYADILENEFCTFGYWLSDQYTVFDILLDRSLTYADLHDEWLEELAYDIHHGAITYFKFVEDEE